MKTQKLTLALLAATLLLPGWLRAQQTFTAPLTVNATTPAKLEFRADGTLISKGNIGAGNLTASDEGIGPRMLWYPAKAAFRAGAMEERYWSDADIGHSSIGLGTDSSATGEGSVAIGYYNSAYNSWACAIGSGCYAGGVNSTAIGQMAHASGTGSVAIGYSTISCGTYSTAFGLAFAGGYVSTAFGEGYAGGSFSTAAGIGTEARSYASFVVGRYNVGGGNLTTWVGTDPLFEVGNGTADNAKASALIVYKNGDIKIPKPQGDIPMGEFQ